MISIQTYSASRSLQNTTPVILPSIRMFLSKVNGWVSGNVTDAVCITAVGGRFWVLVVEIGSFELTFREGPEDSNGVQMRSNLS
jgi:hypothetical protein